MLYLHKILYYLSIIILSISSLSILLFIFHYFFSLFSYFYTILHAFNTISFSFSLLLSLFYMDNAFLFSPIFLFLYPISNNLTMDHKTFYIYPLLSFSYLCISFLLFYSLANNNIYFFTNMLYHNNH